ncbi:MAG: isochorismatase family protein [Syntrophales bacterium]|nr:isochorismatase family protein [Syntrophales bacterium]
MRDEEVIRVNMEHDYLEQIRDYNVRQALPVAEKAALLVIDVQEYFRTMVEPIMKNLLALIETGREKGVKIFFTRHGHFQPDKDGGMLGKWWGDLIEYGSPEWELLGELNPSEKEPVIDKNRYSAFFNTDLDDRLRGLGIEDLIICGVMTNCCCETTARDAFVRDYRVFFAADATATANRELHLASLKNLAFGFAHIVNTVQICRHFGKSVELSPDSQKYSEDK